MQLVVTRPACPYCGDTADWASQPWTHLLARCKQVAAAIDPTQHVATRRIVGLLGLPYALYAFSSGVCNLLRLALMPWRARSWLTGAQFQMLLQGMVLWAPPPLPGGLLCYLGAAADCNTYECCLRLQRLMIVFTVPNWSPPCRCVCLDTAAGPWPPHGICSLFLLLVPDLVYLWPYSR